MSKEIILVSIIVIILFGGFHLILNKLAELRELLDEDISQDGGEQ